MEEAQDDQPEFMKLRQAVDRQLRLLTEDQVTWISFDWNNSENYLKVSYNLVAPIE